MLNSCLSRITCHPQNLFLAFPDFQIEFGQTAVLPIVKASDFQVLGLDREWIYLTKCVYRGNRVYKAACIESCKELVVKRSDLPDFMSVVQFDLSGCRSLLSGHLEQVSIACPNLQQLGLQCNKRCLRKLQGLQSVAANCEQLNGLNLVTIGDVENQVQILSSMTLGFRYLLDRTGCCRWPTDRTISEINKFNCNWIKLCFILQ